MKVSRPTVADELLRLERHARRKAIKRVTVLDRISRKLPHGKPLLVADETGPTPTISGRVAAPDLERRIIASKTASKALQAEGDCVSRCFVFYPPAKRVAAQG